MNKLREERARLYGEMRDLLDGTNDRGMSGEEAEKYGRLEAEVERLTSDIAARDRAAELEKRMEEPRPVDDAVLRGKTERYTDEQKEYNRAFSRYLRGDRAAAQYLTRDQNVGTDADGGFTVPDSFRNKLVDRLQSFGGLASVAETIVTADGRNLDWVTLDDVANEGQVVAEAGTPLAGADLVFGSKSLGAFRYMAPGPEAGGLRVSVELLQDSAFDIESMIVNKLGQRIARAQAAHWATGAGTTEPTGLMSAAADHTLPVGSTTSVAKDDLIDILHALDPAYRPGAVWLFSDATLAEVRKLEDTTGRPLLQDFASSGIGGGLGGFSLLGHPVVIDQGVADMAASAKFAAFGDMRESYVIRRVRDVQVIVDPYTRAANGQVLYTLWARADGTIQNDNSFVVAANSAT